MSRRPSTCESFRQIAQDWVPRLVWLTEFFELLHPDTTLDERIQIIGDDIVELIPPRQTHGGGNQKTVGWYIKQLKELTAFLNDILNHRNNKSMCDIDPIKLNNVLKNIFEYKNIESLIGPLKNKKYLKKLKEILKILVKQNGGARPRTKKRRTRANTRRKRKMKTRAKKRTRAARA